MRIAQIVIRRLLGLCILGIGVSFITLEPLWLQNAVQRLPQGQPFRGILAALLIIVGLLAVLPSIRLRRRHKTISFPGTHGNVVIQLDSVEASLNRVIGKMPDVKKISVSVLSAEDSSKVRIAANVWLYKGIRSNARELAEHISNSIATTAANILGVEEVATVNLNVRGIILDTDEPEAAAAAVAEQPLEEETPPPLLQPDEEKTEPEQSGLAEAHEVLLTDVSSESEETESESSGLALEEESEEQENKPGLLD